MGKKKKIARISQENFPRHRPKKYPLSRENGNMHATPYAFEWGWGHWGGIQNMHNSSTFSVGSRSLARGLSMWLLDTYIADFGPPNIFVCNGMKRNWTPNSPQMCIFGHPILKSWLKPWWGATCTVDGDLTTFCWVSVIVK